MSLTLRYELRAKRADMKIRKTIKSNKRHISGYQVRTADMEGISFEDYSLEKCKEYCRKGYVVVSTYRKKFAFRVSLTFGPRYYLFHYERFGRMLNILWLSIRWEWLWTNRPLEIVYRNDE